MNRFFKKVEKTDGCWNWTASKRKGYGAFKYKGKIVGAHRFSYELHKGVIPEDMVVCHKCDNPKCVNPDHLFLGTQSDNMKDAYKKGRLKVPEGVKFKNNHIPKSRSVDIATVVKIKNMLNKGGIKPAKIAEKLSVSRFLVYDIRRGQAYKSIDTNSL